MWDKLLEFGQQLLKLKGQVSDNTSELTELKNGFKRLSAGTHKLLHKIKLMEQQHTHEIQLIKENHAAQIQRLEDQIHHLKESYDDALEKSNMSAKTQILEVMNQHLQGQILISGLGSQASENNSEKRITEA